MKIMAFGVKKKTERNKQSAWINSSKSIFIAKLYFFKSESIIIFVITDYQFFVRSAARFLNNN